MFAGASGEITEDNPNFYWDNTNKRLGVGTNTPRFALELLSDGGILSFGNFGSGPIVPTVFAAGSRMFWYPRKAAFKVGYTTLGTLWTDSNIGNYSFAAGYEPVARGAASFAAGYYPWADKDGAVALGYLTRAEGRYSFATGYNSRAYGQSDIAMGWSAQTSNFGVSANNIAIGPFARVTGTNISYGIAIGYSTLVTSYNSIAIGPNTRAQAVGSTALGAASVTSGYATTAIGGGYAQGSSSVAFTGAITGASSVYATALGYFTSVNGRYSTGIGYFLQVDGSFLTVVGTANESISSNISFDPLSPVFVVGNGDGSPLSPYPDRSNAMVVLFNGDVGIGTNTPTYRLQVGNNGDGTSAIANAWNLFSDRRWKKNIKKVENALDKVLRMQGVYYEWKSSGKKSVGFIAQDLLGILPEVVTQDYKGYYAVDYSKITPVLVEAVKEQNKLVLSNKKKILRIGRILELDERLQSSDYEFDGGPDDLITSVIDVLKQKLLAIEERLSKIEGSLKDLISRVYRLERSELSGKQELSAGVQEVKISFGRSFDEIPYVFLSVYGNSSAYRIKEITKEFFILRFDEVLQEDIVIHWLARSNVQPGEGGLEILEQKNPSESEKNEQDDSRNQKDTTQDDISKDNNDQSKQEDEGGEEAESTESDKKETEGPSQDDQSSQQDQQEDDSTKDEETTSEGIEKDDENTSSSEAEIN